MCPALHVPRAAGGRPVSESMNTASIAPLQPPRQLGERVRLHDAIDVRTERVSPM